MSPEEFLSVASQAKELLASAATVILFFLGFIYVRSRAGSGSFFRDRIWRILGGRKEFSDPALNELCSQLRDYEKFNYNTGIKFRSQKKISETLQWLRDHDIGLEEIIRIKSYFNSNKIEISRPLLLGYNVAHWASIVFFIVASTVFMASSLPAALLTIKKTQTQIWASTTVVTSLNGFDWKVRPEDCGTEKLQKMDLDSHDKEVICELLIKKESVKHLESAMFGQKLIGLGVWLLFGLLAFLAARALLIANLAEGLFQRTSAAVQIQKEIPSE
jgi:hypothetical protein